MMKKNNQKKLALAYIAAALAIMPVLGGGIAEQVFAAAPQAASTQATPALPDGSQPPAPPAGSQPPAPPQDGSQPPMPPQQGDNAPAAPSGQPGFNPPDTVTQGTAVTNLTEKGNYKNRVYMSTGNDENALRITGAKVGLKDVAVHKNGGSSSNTEGGDFYGMNAALLATDGAKVTIEKSEVTSSAQNGNGLFSYGKGTSLTAKDVTITTSGNNSGGIQTTGGASTTAQNLKIKTSGNSSAAIRSDRGGGTVRVKGGTYETSGSGSPAIYSTADIAVQDAALQANHSEGAVIEGKNKIALKNSTLEGSMDSVRVMGQNKINEENVHTVMIYQSMSGDAEEGTSSFSMTGGKLISHHGDVFYVTNTDCTIDLANVAIDNLDQNGALLRVAGNSASRGWGKAGANGGTATVTTKKQDLHGNIIVDSVSKLDLNLDKGTHFTGAITMPVNKDGTRTDAGVNLNIAKGATWNLTADSTVTTLNNKGTINRNGHKLTILK